MAGISSTFSVFGLVEKITGDLIDKIGLSSPDWSFYIDHDYNYINLDLYVEYKGFRTFAIKMAKDSSQLEYEKSRMPLILKKTQFRLGIIIDADSNYYVCRDGDERITKMQVGDILKIIRKDCSSISFNPDKDKIKSKLLKIFRRAKFKNKKDCKEIFENACDNLIIKDGVVKMQQKDEIGLFSAMFGKVNNDSVCRYMSLDSLFTILHEQSIYMNAPISMNDTSEAQYSDSYMPFYVNLEKWERNIKEIIADNNAFILSCSSIEKEDDLTLWRLYGEESKGVCIKFVVDYSKIDNQKFFFAPVCYGEGKNNHPELSFLKNLREANLDKGWRFLFNKWYCWKYFFKSYEYADEKEVRLLYIPSSEKEYPIYDWYKDRNNGIFNVGAKFSLLSNAEIEFPLSIDSLILGSKSPCSSVNKDQIRLMAVGSEIKLGKDFNVEKSRIDNYR